MDRPCPEGSFRMNWSPTRADRRPNSFQCSLRHSKFNNFKQFGVQDAANCDIAWPQHATHAQPPPNDSKRIAVGLPFRRAKLAARRQRNRTGGPAAGGAANNEAPIPISSQYVGRR